MPSLSQLSQAGSLEKRWFGNDCYAGDNDCDGGLSYGARVGIGIGIVVLFLVIATAVTAGIRRRRYQAFMNSSNPSANPGYSNPYASAQQNTNPYMNTQLYGNGPQPQAGNTHHYGAYQYPPPSSQPPPKEGEEAFVTVDGFQPPAGPPPPTYQPPAYSKDV